MAAAPPMQLPFCRANERPAEETAPDVVIGRLVSRVAQLEQQLYRNELQDHSIEGSADNLISRIATFLQRSSADLASHLNLGPGFQDAAEEPSAPARIAAQSIINATERMKAAEHEAGRLARLLADSLQAGEAMQAELDATRTEGAAQAASLAAELAAASEQSSTDVAALEAELAAAQEAAAAATAWQAELEVDLASTREEADLLQGRLRQVKASADAARAELAAVETDGAAREALLQGRLVELVAEAGRRTEVAGELRAQVRQLLGAAADAALAQGALQQGQQLLGLAAESALARSALQAEIHGMQRQLVELAERHAASAGELEAVQAAAADFERKFIAERQQRRQVHEQLQLLRGNIRVLCRVRPSADGESAAVDCPLPGEVVVRPADKRPQGFEFPSVFGPEATQEEIFEEVRPLVRSALDGYSACIFAYGQTGSGKTFTMDGPEAQPGINSRALRMLFDVAAAEQEQRVSLSIAFLEVYLESIRDLLVAPKDAAPLDVSGLAAGQLGSGADRVPGLTWRPVNSAGDISAALKEARRNRTTAGTAMNAHSSRSHSMLSVRLQPVAGGPPSVLHLVDLAGSERVAKSEAAGQQLKEAQSINRSLSALGDVIAALQAGAAHVPYRNSKLTQVLQDALCSATSSKALLVCNVAPEAASAAESLSSLHFAQRAAQVELSPPRRAVSESPPGRKAAGAGTGTGGGESTPARSRAVADVATGSTTQSPSSGYAAARRTPLAARDAAATPMAQSSSKGHRTRSVLAERRQSVA